jgi:hypothetical protein
MVAFSETMASFVLPFYWHVSKMFEQRQWALLNLSMNRNKGPHPSPLPTGAGISLLAPYLTAEHSVFPLQGKEISLLAPLSLGRGGGGEGN